MSNQNKRKKPAPNYYTERVITISMPQEVKTHLDMKARKVGLSTTAYCRMLLLQRLDQLGYSPSENG